MSKRIIGMEQLFKKKDLNVSLEMLDLQPNDKVVTDLIDYFNDLILLNGDEIIRSTYDMFKNKATLGVIKLLDSTITSRFGINFKHIATESNNYGVLTTPPVNFNVLNNDVEDTYKSIKESVEELAPYFKKNKIENISDDTDFYSIIANWRDSFKSLDDKLKTSNVVIDNKRGVIKGLPSSYNVIILGDLYFLIETLNLSARELTAILLHEVGHAYTHIEYSYRTVNQTMVLVDTIRDTIIKNNGSIKKALVLGYEKAFDEKLVTKSNTEIEAMIAISNKYLNSTRYISRQYHSYTDSEQLADQFASKFGLQLDLVSGLNKLTAYHNNPLVKLGDITLSLLPAAIIFGIASLSFLFGAGILVIGIITVYLFETIIEIFDSLTTAGGTRRASTYDDSKRRVIRIKNELVRSIRLSNVDKATMGVLISNVEEINLLLNKIPDDKVSVIDSFFRKLFSVSDDAINSKLLEQMIEDVAENELHVISQKFKTI